MGIYHLNTARGLIEAFDNIRSFSRGGEPAPHKALLLLAALASVQRREPRLLLYSQLEPQLRDLLRQFGWNSAPTPHYPFWRLRRDGMWEVPEEADLLRLENASGDVPVTALRELSARGGFTEQVYRQLRRNPRLVNELAARVLERSFPPTLHESILDAVGFPWVAVPKRRRDPKFREHILRVYERRCAVCGYDGRLGSSELGLDAAHVRWHAAGGPDDASNGIALCSYHHVALDRGALGISTDLKIQVSQDAVGTEEVQHVLHRFSGAPLRRPLAGATTLHEDFVNWHATYVFRAPARVAS